MKTMIGLVLALLGLGTVAAASDNCSQSTGCVPLTVTVSSGAGASAIAIPGATVTIYQTKPGSPRVLAEGTSDDEGQFSLKLPPDGNDDIRYAVARKGQAIELAAVIGTTTPSAITINEMTTVAAAYAMAQFFRDGQIVGKSLPLQVAAGMAANLASVTTGTVSPVIQAPPNANETNALRSLGTLSNIVAACVQDTSAACAPLFGLAGGPQAPIATTTLQAALNIARNPTTNLKQLFALGEVVRAYEPYLSAEHGPDSSNELLRLDGFTLAVKVNATGNNANGTEDCPFGGPGNIAFDARGNAWITNNVVQGGPDSAHCFAVLKPNGQAADGARGSPKSPIFGGGIVGQGFGIGIDPFGNVWAGNFGWGKDLPTGSVSKFTPTGQPISPSAGYVDGLSRVQGTTSDQHGNIWMASTENDSVQVFRKGYPNPHTVFPGYIDQNTTPFHIVIDDEGNAWVSYSGTSVVSKFALSDSGPVRQFTVPLETDSRPKGMALDSRGNVWVAAGAPSLIYAVDSGGNLLGGFSGGGTLGPWGVGVDSADNVWVANFGPEEQIQTKYRVSRLCGASVENCPPGSKLGDPISPDTGYTLPSGGDQVLLHNGDPLYAPLSPPSFKPLMRATAAHIDMAGNVWITNNWKPSGLNDVALNPGGDGIVIFVGLAAPVKPTFTGQPKAP